MSEGPKISPEEFKRVAYDGEWWQLVDAKEARPAHEENIARCAEAIEYHEDASRPLHILVVHGSGRSSVELSCAHEPSNSKLLLRRGLKAVIDDDVVIDEVDLREHKIEYCNCCYSTASALCGFPCNCFPFDPMQELYPKVLQCDIMLMSTGVNQSSMSSRLKAFCDRLISLDGGYFVSGAQLKPKDSEWRARAIAVSRNQPIVYDQRMHGRVAAFFVSSKDDLDQEKVGDPRDEMPSYVDMTLHSLYTGFWDFGFYFADPWSAVHASMPNEELSSDKRRLNEDKDSHLQAEKAVRAAVALAQEFRANPPESRPHPVGRT